MNTANSLTGAEAMVHMLEDPADIEKVLTNALAASEPTLVDILTQPLDEAAAPVSERVA